jgi:hypothetical protein
MDFRRMGQSRENIAFGGSSTSDPQQNSKTGQKLEDHRG